MFDQSLNFLLSLPQIRSISIDLKPGDDLVGGLPCAECDPKRLDLLRVSSSVADLLLPCLDELLHNKVIAEIARLEVSYSRLDTACKLIRKFDIQHLTAESKHLTSFSVVDSEILSKLRTFVWPQPDRVQVSN
jgi:hypothetical protein